MLVIAHRGACTEALENSYESFEKAIDAGAQRIELDVQVNASQQLVVMHDKSLRRTVGRHFRVSRLTKESLGLFLLENGETIPTLESVLQKYGDKIEFNVELKDKNTSCVSILCNTIEKTKPSKKIVVSSFNHKLIESVADKCPSLTRALLFHQRSDIRNFSRLEEQMEKAESSIIHPEATIIDLDFMNFAKSKSWQVFPYISIKKEKPNGILWDRLKILGVDGLCTNYPRELRSWLSHQSAGSIT